jgi:hypothetical protein
MLDEAVASDSDYVYSEGNPTASQFEVKLSSGGDPVSSVGHIVRYRVSKNATGTTNFTFNLMQGAVTIATWNENDVTEAYASGEYTLSAGEANSITDYSDLRIRCSATVV